MSQSQAHAVKHEQLAEKGMPQKSQFCLIFTLIDQAVGITKRGLHSIIKKNLTSYSRKLRWQ
jgi:hypothetical protein